MKEIFLLLIFLPPLLSYSAPMSCTEISLTANYTYSSDNTTNLQYYTAKFSIFKNDTASYLKAYDLSGFDSSSNGGIMSGYCYIGVEETCSNNFTKSYVVFPLDIYETSSRFLMVFYDIAEEIFDANIDDGTFSIRGILYSSEYPCTNVLNDRTMCCTKFVPAPEVNGTFPRCKYFRSRSTIHNSSDYSIIATSSMNYFLIGNFIHLRGNYSVATDVAYFINGREFESDYGLNGIVFLPRGDSKFLFSTNFNNWFYQVPTLRLFLIRNGQTLMKEGVPYTKENDCQYYSVTDNLRKMPTSIEVCCKEFEPISL